MTISREEFFRLLPAAVGPFEVDGETIRGSGGDCRWRLDLVPLPDRRVGSVTVPRQQIVITIEACSGAEAGAFMERFHRGFLRGGG